LKSGGRGRPSIALFFQPRPTTAKTFAAPKGINVQREKNGGKV
jgi:hypothetical protein